MSFSVCSWCSWLKWEHWADLRFHLFVSGVNQRNESGRWVQDFFVSPRGSGSFSSVVSPARWCHLVRVEYLYMIKPMVAVFVLLEVDVILGNGCGIWEHWHGFREVKCLHACSKTIWFSFLVLLKERYQQN